MSPWLEGLLGGMFGGMVVVASTAWAVAWAVRRQGPKLIAQALKPKRES